MAEDRITAFMQDMAGRYIPGMRAGSDVLELFATHGKHVPRAHNAQKL